MNNHLKYIVIVLVFISNSVFSQESTTYQFAEREGTKLYLDLYQPSGSTNKDQCIVYLFGGGFISGARNNKGEVQLCQALANEGYTTIAIDYRLGLKGVKKVGVANTEALERAIDIAVEDLFSATAFLIANSEKLNINTNDIVLIGSSAGAITVLQADYNLNNRFEHSDLLPEDFHYGGVIPFAGAIFSDEGKVRYRVHPPAPTFFLHGTDDKLVRYNQIKMFNKGFFGANALVKAFEKYNYPYVIRRYEAVGHEVAGLMSSNIAEIKWFIDTFVDGGKFLQIDELYHDPNFERSTSMSITPKDLYGNQVETRRAKEVK